jgi:carbon monoxide dehydrogenase subunit G
MTADAEGRYELRGRVEVGATREETLRWLSTPELMDRWMPGASSIEAIGEDGRLIRLEVSHGAYAGWIYVGEIVALDNDRLVRRYELAESRGGVATITHDEQEYERTVTYELGGDDSGPVVLDVSVVTKIPGLGDTAARMGAKAEQRSLNRSLDRLRDEIAGHSPGLLGRLGGTGGSAGPL